ncbi:ATP-dependent RNA helicase dbp10 [Patellaria atrata CBS 101060]|uniref:RNA helicase n=1 Tax=Patellaria atrata CBS 101060 TaxID=1346257 RepID=A0A9P4VQT3_9PEZI|nr:ATP-dependent RNA helicase dbp10 [Patellaria atrata CBS 101060]
MPHRAASPAESENEFDIGNVIFTEGATTQSEDAKARDIQSFDFSIEPVGDEDGDSGDEAFIAARQAASNRKTSNLRGKIGKKGGGFQSMGLNPALQKAITRKGFTVPTPIQRKTIPLILDNQDVVGMARTGSGKTAAFVIPMVEKLKSHSAKVGARGVIMSPSRELALQTLTVVKELSRGTDLRVVLLVGGEGLEEQFASVASNPDIIIATPGRFLHLKVEMGLDLSSVKYIVFDEADRLFEMGFAVQLTELLYSLPTSRQTLLFSATLPKSLVEFARAGLQEPKLVRLDSESKISPELQSAFFTIKSSEKEGALLHIIQDIIKIPAGPTVQSLQLKDRPAGSKKRKRETARSSVTECPTEYSTIIFTATKHHVEYLAALLRSSGYTVSHVYGALDQAARKMQVQDFRSGLSHILVVTDVAARGIDIPVLANVINYDFPSQPKVFVHRVGRTARAGKTGWSYSLIRDSDTPYLLDLQLFLSRRLVLGRIAESTSFSEDVIVGNMPRDKLESSCELVNNLLGHDIDLVNLRTVAQKGEKLYVRTRNAASTESCKRAKEVFSAENAAGLNMLFRNEVHEIESERERMLARLSGFRPQETVFEIGKRGYNNEAGEIMRKRREKIESQKRPTAKVSASSTGMLDQDALPNGSSPSEKDDSDIQSYAGLDDELSASDEELEITFSQPTKSDKSGGDSWKDSALFMSYTPQTSNLVEDRAYGVQSGSYNTAHHSLGFVEAARGATMDLNQDEARGFAEPSKARGMRWDKKSKKYVARANDEDGSRGVKMVRGESGLKIAAGFRSGRFDAWRRSNKIDRLPRTGEAELSKSFHNGNNQFGKRFKHKAERAPKDADRYRDDFHVQKKRVAEAKEKRIGKFKDGTGKSELKGVHDVRKARQLKEKRREKNARPPKRSRI